LTHSTFSSSAHSFLSFLSALNLHEPATRSFSPNSVEKNGVIMKVLLRVAFSLVSLGAFGVYIPPIIYGDGLTAENLPPATVGDREASLFVKISPPILTTESKENAFLQFRLYDERDNQTIKFVTYEIAIRKASAPQDSKPLLRDFFHARMDY
jgi:hypothetical protein